jgi:hypothetical protein
MKKITYRHLSYLLFSCITVALMMLSACDNDETQPPSISEIRNYDASPNDTVVQTVGAGQWVVLLGKNLSGVSQVYFGSVVAIVNTALSTNESVVVQVPFSIPFESLPAEKVNEITVVSDGGSTTFEFNVTGPPIISRVRNFADSPNDTLTDGISPGQTVNIIGFNLRNVLTLKFQGMDVDVSNIIYTDSSAIVTAPDVFLEGISRANKITYTTTFGTGDYIFYTDPLWTFLTGGVSKSKTWVLDLFKDGNGNAYSKKFKGHIWWASLYMRWNRTCAEGQSCSVVYEDTWQGWMPSPLDYGTMTFKLEGNPINPMVTIVQKSLGEGKDGTFTGKYVLDVEAKTLTFIGAPLYNGWAQTWPKGYLISLTEDGMSIGFPNPGNSNELTVFNYVPK